MSMEEIEEIKSISKIDKKGVKGIEEIEVQPESIAQPNKEKFDSLMVDKTREIAPIEANTMDNSRVGLIDEMNKLNNKVDNLKTASPEQFLAQAQDVTGQMEKLKAKLSTTTSPINGASEDVLKNKLTHIDENIKVALDRAGVEYSPNAKVDGQNPIERFLSLLTDGQARLESIATDVQTMSLNKQEITPAAMLAMQIKVGFIQQEIELFTSLLSKAVESTKTIMNVQV